MPITSLVEQGPMVVEKEIFKSRQYIFTLYLLPPLGKGCGPSFEQSWIPGPNSRILCVQSLV